MVASVRDMFFFMHGPSTHKKAVAVFFGFLDGSNTHDGAKVYSLCGFLGESAAFEGLNRSWNSVLDKSDWPCRPKRFHMVDCVHGDGEFLGWSFPQRLAIFGDLATVIIRHAANMIAIASVVMTEDFGKLPPENLLVLKSEGLGEALDLSVQYAFQKSITLTRNTSEEEKIGLLFDNENQHVMDRCYDFSRVYRTKFGFGKWLTGIGFGSSMEFTPLQAADLYAYCVYRFAMQRYPETAEPYFPITPGLMRMAEHTLHTGGGFDLDSMNMLVEEIKRRHAERDKVGDDEAPEDQAAQ